MVRFILKNCLLFSGHPSCLDMNRQLVKVIQGYPWQCMECKTCTQCSAPHDEVKISFNFCVSVKKLYFPLIGKLNERRVKRQINLTL